MFIDKKYFRTNTVHRNIKSSNITKNDSILSCGFLVKDKSYKQTTFLFKNYGAFYVLSGTGSYVDKNGKEYKLYPGCFVQRMPDVLHSTYVDFDNEWLEFFIEFGRQKFKILSSMGIFSKEPVLYIGKSQKLFSEFINYMNRLKVANDDELPKLMFDVQKILYNINLMQCSSNDDRSFAFEACRAIKENVNVGTDIKNISKSLGLGYESFRKQFKKAVGVSPSEYLISERISIAKIKLLDDGLPIKEVAISLGYSDVFAFTKQFKKYTGITPGEFIKQ